MDHPAERGNGNFKQGKTLSDVIGLKLPSNGRNRMDVGMYFAPNLRESEQLVNSYFVCGL